MGPARSAVHRFPRLLRKLHPSNSVHRLPPPPPPALIQRAAKPPPRREPSALGTRRPEVATAGSTEAESMTNSEVIARIWTHSYSLCWRPSDLSFGRRCGFVANVGVRSRSGASFLWLQICSRSTAHESWRNVARSSAKRRVSVRRLTPSTVATASSVRAVCPRCSTNMRRMRVLIPPALDRSRSPRAFSSLRRIIPASAASASRIGRNASDDRIDRDQDRLAA